MNTDVDRRDGSDLKRQEYLPSCHACGAFARRVEARFCAVCGQQLAKDYYPTDALRASYRQIETSLVTSQKSYQRSLEKSHQKSSSNNRPSHRQPVFQQVKEFDNRASSCPSLAFVTYALVPYLGIIFCLPAIIIGCANLIGARYGRHFRGRALYLESRRASVVGVLLGFVILAVQLCLWWLLQNIPDWVQP